MNSRGSTGTDAAVDSDDDSSDTVAAPIETDDSVAEGDDASVAGGDDASVETDAAAAGTDHDVVDAGSRDVSGTDVVALRSFETNRWTGVAGVTLLLLGAGVFTREASLVLAGAVGVSYAAYARHSDAPAAELDVRRTVDDRLPSPDDEVTVTVAVTNVGDVTLADLRLVDGVPDALEVTDGPARLATSLRPGASASFGYTVRVIRGEHVWDPMRAVTRDPSGANERETQLDHRTTLQCAPELDVGADLPLRGLTTQYHGRVPTDVGGSGVEFYATREYRRGDPLRRIDWNRRARTGEMATLELREERAATVVLVVDARNEAYLAPDPEGTNAVERNVEAAGQLFRALLDGGDRVGIAAMSSTDCWLPPSAGSDHEARARELLATHTALAPTPSEGVFYPSLWLRRLRRRLPNDAQVLLLSPMADRYPVRTARRLDAHGHLVTVLSPDVTVDDTAGHRIARFERTERFRDLRGRGIRVVEWDEGELASAVAGAQRRWQR